MTIFTTATAKKLDLADRRSASLAHLMLEVLPRLQTPPGHVLLENVKGFGDSALRARVIEVLAACGYAVRELLLSPTQLGMPNQRTRYLLLAKRAPLRFAVEPTAYPALLPTSPCTSPACSACHRGPVLAAYLEPAGFDDTPYLVPDSVVVNHGLAFRLLLLSLHLLLLVTISSQVHVQTDIVTPESTEHTCCFTKGYGKLVEGAGSVLQTRKHALPTDTEVTGADLVPCRLRYFTPREVARLHGFPDRLVFPPQLTPRQLYRVLGLCFPSLFSFFVFFLFLFITSFFCTNRKLTQLCGPFARDAVPVWERLKLGDELCERAARDVVGGSSKGGPRGRGGAERVVHGAHAHAERARRERGRAVVLDDEHVARRPRGPERALRCRRVHVGRGLGARDVRARDGPREARCEAVGREGARDGARRVARRDPARHSCIVQPRQQLAHARLQSHAPRVPKPRLQCGAPLGFNLFCTHCLFCVRVCICSQGQFQKQ